MPTYLGLLAPPRRRPQPAAVPLLVREGGLRAEEG
jgi:hypothetical protein